MSRSKRRRKDKSWCRGCDAFRADRNGTGNCKVCGGRLLEYKALSSVESWRKFAELMGARFSTQEELDSI